jgi:hypothetical protein
MTVTATVTTTVTLGITIIETRIITNATMLVIIPMVIVINDDCHKTFHEKIFIMTTIQQMLREDDYSNPRILSRHFKQQ